MAKTKSKKLSGKKRISEKSPIRFDYISITIVTALVLLLGAVIHGYTTVEKYKVLGASTMLARAGEPESGEGSSEKPRHEDRIGSPVVGAPVVSDTRGQCTGPDGKKFESKFRDCQELNATWKKPLQFNPIANDLPSREPNEDMPHSVTPGVSQYSERNRELAPMPPKGATPSGERPFTVQRERAIKNLIKENIVSRWGGQGASNEGSMKNPVSVHTINGVQVYTLKGVSDQKLFGFIPVSIERDVTVSTETGNAVSINQSFLAKFLDSISF